MGLEKKFRVYLNGTMAGPFTVIELCKLPDLSPKTLVCPEGEDSWTGAGEFPDISRAMTQVCSGDYKPEPLRTEDPKKASKTNWRDAVIGDNIPEIKSYSAHSANPSNGNVPSRGPASKPSDFTRLAKHIGQRRKLLLLLLGFVSVGAYYPEADNLSAYLFEFRIDDTAMRTMGRRFHQGGSPHAGDSGKHRARRKNSAEKSRSNHSALAAAQGIVEIGSEDLGNGFLSKTVVITEVHDGIRTQRTATFTVPNHPRKSKRMKSKKSRAARLFPGSSGEIA